MKTLKGLDIMVFTISWGRLCRGVCFLHSFRLITLVFYFCLPISENLSEIFLLKSSIQYFNSCEYCNMEVSCGVFFSVFTFESVTYSFFQIFNCELFSLFTTEIFLF